MSVEGKLQIHHVPKWTTSADTLICTQRNFSFSPFHLCCVVSVVPNSYLEIFIAQKSVQIP